MADLIDRMAVVFEGEVYAFPYPATHNCISHIMKAVYNIPLKSRVVKGFLTESRRFIGASDAARLPASELSDKFEVVNGRVCLGVRADDHA